MISALTIIISVYLTGNVFTPSLLLPSIPSVHYVRCLLLRGKWRLNFTVSITNYYYRSMNKSACLGDIIDSVQNLEGAVQMDIGVTRMRMHHVTFLCYRVAHRHTTPYHSP